MLLAKLIICKKMKDCHHLFFWHTICGLFNRERSFTFDDSMKNRKKHIVKKAFDVFMNEGYEHAYIAVLQEELGMLCGAMYRYFKSKEEMFIDVIDRHVFGLSNRFMPKAGEEMTLARVLVPVPQDLYICLGKQNMEEGFCI